MTTSVDINLPWSSAPIKRIKEVNFTVLRAKDVAAQSVALIDNAMMYEDGGIPARGGLSDPRMGSIDYKFPCETCSAPFKECIGHFGHMELAKPMFHFGFLKTTLKCLRTVCYNCSKLLADPSDYQTRNALKVRNPKKRLQALSIVARGKKRCQQEEEGGEEGGCGGGCGYIQPHYSIDGVKIIIEFQETKEDEDDAEGDRKRELGADEAYNILSRITDEDATRMGFKVGFTVPLDLLLTVLPIPPPPVRPSVSFGGADRAEDDVTMKLMDVLKTNQMLKRQEAAGAGVHVLKEFENLLQYHIFTIIESQIPGLPPSQTARTKKPLKSIRERLKGKEGRLRGNLMGKRVDFSARTVIGGDPNLWTDQVGVPRSIALNMTFPERVTPFNMELMKTLVANGPEKWPGAKYVVRDDGTRMDLRYVRQLDDFPLQYGWQVERHMRNDDLVIFNRQPSLHKMSMMGHRVKVLPFSTFRMNLSVTSPYNADFDGDEMNLHLAQSHETRAEIRHIMFNPRQIVSPQGNRPVMGIVQDSLLASAKFTRRDTFLNRQMVMNLLLWIPSWDGTMPTPCILRPQPLWSGKQILSIMLPAVNIVRDGNISGKNKKDEKDFSRSDCRVIVQSGEIITGIVDKKTIGASSGSMIHLIWLEHGPEAAKFFITVIQQLVNYWLLHTGFTVGCADIVANDETMFLVADTLNKAKEDVKNIVNEAQRGLLTTQPGKTMLQSFEAKVNQKLNGAREDAGRLAADSLDERNNIIAMVNAGSKGSPINIAQIIACVGQQNVEGKRIGWGFRNRTLPHFTKDDFGPESRGFVENSYLAGLTPQEMFFHAMGGREGVIDTACKTSETGYIQRRLVKCMESVKARYDGTVRSELGEIVQFLYGEDGMASEYIEDQEVELLKMSNEELERKYKHQYTSNNYGEGWILNDMDRDEIRHDMEKQSILDSEYEQLVALKERLCGEIFPDGDSKQHMPINIRRMVDLARIMHPPEDDPSDSVSPVALVGEIDKLIKSLQVVRVVSDEDHLGIDAQRDATILLNCHLRAGLASKKLLEQDKLSKKSIEWLFGEVKARFEKSLAHAGEMVGTIAAQSIGEPATQMTLNTFHFAGVGSKNVTLGVPRLKEIINIAKKVKTPSLTVYLQKDVAMDQDQAKTVQSSLEHTTLEKVTSFTQIYYDPDPQNTIVARDEEWVREYYELPDEEDNSARCSPWLLRVQLNNRVMTDKNLQMRDIREKVVNTFLGDIDCIATDDNAEELVLRLRILKENDDEGDEEDYKFLQSIEANILNEMTLKGIIGIQKVFMRKENLMVYDQEKGSFDRQSVWVLDTDGCNLDKVLSVEAVDSTKTFSNDIVEILQVLGIEGVRKSVFKELRAVISFDGSYVNYRHMAVLCDTMTHRGHLMAVSRHGINRTERGPIMKCSFEETVEILMDAAMFCESDYVRGVSENIMLGQLCPIGTNEFDLVMDEDKMKHAVPVLPEGDVDPMMMPASPFQDLDRELIAGPTPYDDAASPMHGIVTPGSATPGEAFFSPEMTPSSPGALSAFSGSPGSPMDMLSSPYGGHQSPGTPTIGLQYTSPTSPAYSPTSPAYFQVTSPAYSMTSPAYHQFSSGTGGTQSGSFSGTTNMRSSDRTAEHTYSPTSPAYSPTSPNYTGPVQATTQSHAYSPTSPAYSPTSPVYTPATSQAASASRARSPAYSSGVTPNLWTPTSPAYSPTSPNYSPTHRSPTSPVYSATEDNAPGTPAYTPQEAKSPYTPPPDSPTSPVYSPTSPTYTATAGVGHSPTSPEYTAAASPESPDYTATDENMDTTTNQVTNTGNVRAELTPVESDDQNSP